jgi:hypothetical protein
MNRAAKAIIAALSAALIGLASFTAVVLFTEPSLPPEQPCPIWAAEAGLTDVESYDQCNRLWSAGYDTLSITQDEYEWNIQDYAYVFGEDA